MKQTPDATSSATPFSKLPGYWTFQLGGWLGFAAFSYVTLTIWYNPGELIPAIHTVLQALLGIAVSHPLRWVAKAVWDAKIWLRILVNGVAIIAASLAWTALRLGAFTWMSGEIISMDDWGGWIFGSFTVMASWAFCYHALKYYRQWIEQRELALEAQKSALEAQAIAQQESIRRLHAENLARESKLRSLKYQLNPHFFFNALNSVASLVQKDNKQGATEMLARIGAFLRASLDEDDALQHTLRDEIDILNQYLGIEKVRFGDRLNVEFNVDEDAQSVEIPNLLLQPLFENSIKHAVGRSLSPTLIRLDARRRGERLEIIVTDNGPGKPTASNGAAERSPGIGLHNVRQRLQSVYGDDFEFSVSQDRTSGFEVLIRLPCGAPGHRPFS
ncbi:Histidine kinase [Amphiplicatus metriothermophilus]|uniref:Histidine kinase n=2 Tax=Amphiplicatus metriothermophilus TaxID=1519374 RepID=A0A239PRN8_9PROT|nr:Histidine kinase [Amphiplicatus metriothermophilus]